MVRLFLISAAVLACMPAAAHTRESDIVGSDVTARIEVDFTGMKDGVTTLFSDRVEGWVLIRNSGTSSHGVLPGEDGGLGVALYEVTDTGVTRKEWTMAAPVIEAGGSVGSAFTLGKEGLEDGRTYMVVAECMCGQTHSISDTLAFEVCGGSAVWMKDGTAATAGLEDGTLVIPEGTVAARIEGSENLCEASPNPNCIFYVTGIPQESLAGRNVVAGGRTERLDLTDGYPFHAPARFTAGRAVFEYRTLTQGWDAIALPFDCMYVVAPDINGDWSLHVDVRELTGVSGNSLLSKDVKDGPMTCDRPYIVRLGVPGMRLQFLSEDVGIGMSASPVAALGDVAFMGTFTGNEEPGIYTMSDDGKAFTQHGKAGPFRGYLTSRDELPDVLYIDSENPDAISSPIADKACEGKGVTVLTTDGRVVYEGKDMPQLGRGLYIVRMGGKTVKMMLTSHGDKLFKP